MPPLLLLVQEAAPAGGEEGFTPFSINTGLIKSVEERERRIQQQLEEAERARAEAVRLLEEHKRAIAGARAEAQEIVAKAKSVAEKERETLLAKARQEYEQLLEANLDSQANRCLVTEYLENLERAR